MTSPSTPPHNQPHGTPQAPLLTVRGEAELQADPELARITITITARGKDRRTTLDDLTHRNTTATELITSYGDAVDNHSTGTITITPEPTPRGRGERIRTYHGRIHLTATLTDFTALGELLTRLADLDLTAVEGPWWALRPTSPVYRTARQEAVRDAVRRAQEYAEALTTTVAALVELADTGPGAPSPRGFGTTRSARRTALATPDSTPPEPLDLEPRRIDVRAEVTAQFTMIPPAL